MFLAFYNDKIKKNKEMEVTFACYTMPPCITVALDTDTKERAASAPQAMGLSVSDAIRMLMLRIADEHRLPFEVKVPSSGI